MKNKDNKKKQENSPQLSAAELHAKKQLERHNKSIRKREEEKKKQNEELFKSRVKNTPAKKVIFTSRTKAYYRYSKNFSCNVDTNGFRLNSPEVKKTTKTGKILFILSFIALIIFTFTVTFTALKISAHVPEPPAEKVEAENLHGLFISPDDFSLGKDKIYSLLQENGCNTAVIPFKDADGYIYFSVESAAGNAGSKTIANAWDTVASLSESGIKTVAYISCFSDTAAASDISMSIKSGENIFVDTNSKSWLDPYSDKACDYILNIIKSAAKGNFDYILLDNISYPYSYSGTSPSFGAGNNSPSDNNAELNYFIDLAVSTAGLEKLIVLSDAYGFCGSPEEENGRYAGNILNNTCSLFSVDLRLSLTDKSVKDTRKLYRYINEMPEVFMLDAADAAAKSAEKNNKKIIFGCFENSQKNTAYIEELNVCGIDNYIIF